MISGSYVMRQKYVNKVCAANLGFPRNLKAGPCDFLMLYLTHVVLPLKHVNFKLSVNLKLFFFKNASCEIGFDTIIAVFTDFKLGVKICDINFEIGENSNNCIKTDFALSVFEKK